jgi:hypothetical protein
VETAVQKTPHRQNPRHFGTIGTGNLVSKTGSVRPTFANGVRKTLYTTKKPA